MNMVKMTALHTGCRPQGHRATGMKYSMKFKVNLLGFEIATFRFEKQCLTQIRHFLPHLNSVFEVLYMKLKRQK